MKMQDLKKLKMSEGSGVYLFKNGRKILYIGEAVADFFMGPNSEKNKTR